MGNTIKAGKVVSVKAELAVLRGMCHKDKKIAGTLIGAVDESYFYSPESVEIYRALLRNLGVEGERPSYRLLIEDPELSDEARKHFKDSEATLWSVADATKATKILNRYRQRRGIFNLANYLAESLKAGKVDVDEVLHKAATDINTTRASKSTENSFVHFGRNNSSMKIVNSLLDDDLSEDIIPTGIKVFDTQSGGVARGSLFTIGANSGGGKSTLASALAVNMASRGYKVVLVPLEMSKREMTARIMANVTKTDLTKILLQKMATSEKELVRKRFKRWLSKVRDKGGRYTIYKPEEDQTIEEVFASLSALDCDVVIIDYISLLKGVDGDDQVRALGQVARYAKVNADHTNRVNILLCQLNEEGKIKYSRAISEHSANCWTWMVPKDAKENGVATVKVEQQKSRNSMAFPFMLRILYNLMRVEDAEIEDDSTLGTVKTKGKQLPNLAADV